MSHYLHHLEVEDWEGKFYAEFEIDFTYWPGEPMQRHCSDGSGYPGSPPGVEINSVKIIQLEDDDHVYFKDLAGRNAAWWWIKSLEQKALDYVLKRERELYAELISTADHWREQ